jgi:UDP:flavonoid glycosyltransferase YjiC (YdhE family)
MRTKLLFFCETVTMAHLMRSWTLLKEIDRTKYEIHLAACEVPEFLKAEITQHVQLWPLDSSPRSADFLRHLAKGSLPYTFEFVEKQVAEDLMLIEKIQPQLVVGDFRLSLAISARAKKIPYINLTNITWHPDASLRHCIPDHWITRALGETLALPFSLVIQPIVLRKAARAYASAAARHGITIPKGLLELYVEGDQVFYADTGKIVHGVRLRPNEVIGGPILASIASMGNEIPVFPKDRPTVVVSLGSSGPQKMIHKIVAALEEMNFNLIISTGGQNLSLKYPERAFVSHFIPLDQVLKQAQCLIFNGGSATGYMGLSNGVPLLSIPSNIDQMKFTDAVVQRGAGLRLRIEKLNRRSLQKTMQQLISDPAFSKSAREMEAEIKNENAVQKFQETVHQASLIIAKPAHLQ